MRCLKAGAETCRLSTQETVVFLVTRQNFTYIVSSINSLKLNSAPLRIQDVNCMRRPLDSEDLLKSVRRSFHRNHDGTIFSITTLWGGG